MLGVLLLGGLGMFLQGTYIIGRLVRWRRRVRLSDNKTLEHLAGKALKPFKTLAVPKRKATSHLTTDSRQERHPAQVVLRLGGAGCFVTVAK